MTKLLPPVGKLCPLKMVGNLTIKNTNPDFGCEGERCHWWCPDGRVCPETGKWYDYGTCAISIIAGAAQ